jgi:hypothetical protein
VGRNSLNNEKASVSRFEALFFFSLFPYRGKGETSSLRLRKKQIFISLMGKTSRKGWLL